MKEEYYLADFEPDRAVLDLLGLDSEQPLAVVRTPPAVSLYHRFENNAFSEVLVRLREQGQVVVLPRTEQQRAELVSAGGFVIPELAVDGPSLVALADLVVSAGGTMNREAVALGTPVLTSFEGKIGAVDEKLIADGRMGRLENPSEIVIQRRSQSDQATADAERLRRDPELLVELLLSAR